MFYKRAIHHVFIYTVLSFRQWLKSLVIINLLAFGYQLLVVGFRKYKR